jgi:plastocyanin
VTPKPPVPEEEQQQGETPPAAEEPATAPANTINATILPGASAQGNPDYDPDPITIKQGDGVQWTNQDNAPHTVTSRQEGVFDSSLINPANSWLLNTAEIAPAEYEYYCTLHPFMAATLVVSNGAAPVESSGNDTASPGGAINNQSGTSTNETAAGNNTNTSATSNGPPASGSVTTVSIAVGASVSTSAQSYEPNNAETTVGSMVTWINDDTAPHTVTSGTIENNRPTPDGSFDSGIINPGDSFPFVFDKAGEYQYYCSIHPWMTGKVTSS